jgi:hypothetical protein
MAYLIFNNNTQIMNVNSSFRTILNRTMFVGTIWNTNSSSFLDGATSLVLPNRRLNAFSSSYRVVACRAASDSKSNSPKQLVFSKKSPDYSKCTTGVIPSDESVMIQNESDDMSPNVKQIYNKLDSYTGEFKELDKKSLGYKADLEKNNVFILEYVKKQFSSLFPNQSAVESVIFKPETYKDKDNSHISYPSTTILKGLPKVLSRGAYSGFMSAISARIQQRKDLLQQVKVKGLDENDLIEMRSSLLFRSKALALNSRVTQSKSYLQKTSKEQKIYDRAAFDHFLNSKTDIRVKIIFLSISDIPLSENPEVITRFELDPGKPENLEAMRKLLITFKEGLIQDFKRNAKGFDLDAKLSKF